MKSDALSSINNILTSSTHRADELLLSQDWSYLDLRGQCAILLAAFLEGRQNRETHAVLAQRLETKFLTHYGHAVEIELSGIRRKYFERCDLSPAERARMANLEVSLTMLIINLQWLQFTLIFSTVHFERDRYCVHGIEH